MATPTVDLRPGKLNIRTSRGDTVAVPITIQEDGLAANLTGRTYSAQIRRSKASATAVTVTVDTADAATGQLVLRLTASATASLSGDYLWDLQQTIGGSVRTILEGRWTFGADVTRT
jgi:hypothetical protein